MQVLLFYQYWVSVILIFANLVDQKKKIYFIFIFIYLITIKVKHLFILSFLF